MLDLYQMHGRLWVELKDLLGESVIPLVLASARDSKSSACRTDLCAYEALAGTCMGLGRESSSDKGEERGAVWALVQTKKRDEHLEALKLPYEYDVSNCAQVLKSVVTP
jgi:hypothetical protein